MELFDTVKNICEGAKVASHSLALLVPLKWARGRYLRLLAFVASTFRAVPVAPVRM